ncbi:hypothetical protein T265_14539, partial [Opisthorchis viverrini]
IGNLVDPKVRRNERRKEFWKRAQIVPLDSFDWSSETSCQRNNQGPKLLPDMQQSRTFGPLSTRIHLMLNMGPVGSGFNFDISHDHCRFPCGEMAQRLERRSTDWNFNGSNLTFASRLPMSRLGQPGSIPVPCFLLVAWQLGTERRPKNEAAWCRTFSCLRTSQTIDSAEFQSPIFEFYLDAKLARAECQDLNLNFGHEHKVQQKKELYYPTLVLPTGAMVANGCCS